MTKQKEKAALRATMRRLEATLSPRYRETADRAIAMAEEAKKEAAAAGNREVAAFQALFDQVQTLVNKMGAIRRSVDQETAGKLSRAMLALAEAIKKEAE